MKGGRLLCQRPATFRFVALSQRLGVPPVRPGLEMRAWTTESWPDEFGRSPIDWRPAKRGLIVSAPANKRVRFQDVKPFDAPARLDELKGPASGPIRLPPWVYWGPSPVANLDVEGDAIRAYQATIQEGRTVDQVQILNRDRLVTLWPELSMPPRARALWENRFPELTMTA